MAHTASRRAAPLAFALLGLLLLAPLARAQTAASTNAQLPPVVPAREVSELRVLIAGAGAVAGVLITDLVTGGALLAPLGLPSAASMLTIGPAVVAAVPPSFTIIERAFAGAASVAAALSGGYLGAYWGKAEPDFIRLPD
jgi:hypothetical protein